MADATPTPDRLSHPRLSLASNNWEVHYLGRLFDAIANLENVEDGPKVMKQFMDGLHTQDVIMEKCREILFAAQVSQENGSLIPNTPTAKHETYENVEDRLENIIAVLKQSKAVCKQLLAPPYVHRLVGQPKAELRMKHNNKVLNDKKSRQNKLGARIMAQGLDESWKPPQSESPTRSICQTSRKRARWSFESEGTATIWPMGDDSPAGLTSEKGIFHGSPTVDETGIIFASSYASESALSLPNVDYDQNNSMMATANTVTSCNMSPVAHQQLLQPLLTTSDREDPSFGLVSPPFSETYIYMDDTSNNSLDPVSLQSTGSGLPVNNVYTNSGATLSGHIQSHPHKDTTQETNFRDEESLRIDPQLFWPDAEFSTETSNLYDV